MKTIRQILRESFNDDPVPYVVLVSIILIVAILVAGLTLSSIYGGDDNDNATTHTQYIPIPQAPIVIPRNR